MRLSGSLFLVDTSAASRMATNPAILKIIDGLLDDGLAATCVTTDLEAGYSARRAGDVAAVHRLRAAGMATLPITEAAGARAREVQALLASRGLHRAVGPVDLLTAAIAEQHQATVLHYDADFEHIASVTGQRHMWVAPRGSVS